VSIEHETEVEHFDEVVIDAVVARVNVGGVHESVLVRFGERVAGLAQQVGHALGWLRAEAVDQRLEIDAVEQLHHVVERALARDAKVVELDRVGRTQRRRRARLACEKPQQAFRVLRAVLDQHLRPDELHGGRTCQHAMVGPPHLRHASDAESFDEAITSDLARLHDSGAQPMHDERHAVSDDCRQKR
jgi:hypothetical protein